MIIARLSKTILARDTCAGDVRAESYLGATPDEDFILFYAIVGAGVYELIRDAETLVKLTIELGAAAHPRA